MRVLLAHSRYRYSGGEERHLDLLEQSLRSSGVDVMRYEREASEFRGVRKLALGLGIAYRPSTALEVRRLVRDGKIDLVHVHNLLPVLTPSVLRSAKGAGAGVVLTAHNYRLFCPAGTLVRNGEVHDDCIRGSSLACGLRNARGTWPESIAYGLALELHRRLHVIDRWVDRVVAPSAYLGRTLVAAGVPAGKVKVIPNGVEVGDWEPRTGRYALYTGRLVREKGVETLLEAARTVPHVPVVIAGAGPLESVLRGDLPDNVEYVGFLSEAHVAELREGAAFVVVPSEWPDVQPFSALEALAAGKPIVVSDQGGLPELVGPLSGVVVRSGDAAALGEAMARMWNDCEADDRRSRAAWESAREHYELERQTGDVLALYEEVVGRR